MYKIAIIGSENSHCMGFASILCPKEGERRLPDLELIGVAGDEASSRAILDSTACPSASSDPSAYVGSVDAVMITARHGGDHLRLVKPYIDAGCRKIWLDKPITASVEEAEELVRLVKEKNVLLCGGSSVAGAPGTKYMQSVIAENGGNILGGHVTAPINLVNPYGNFWFYSQHLVQLVTEVFGQRITSLSAKEAAHGVHAIFHYPDYDVTAFFGAGYGVNVYMSNYWIEWKDVPLIGEYYWPELVEVAEMLRNGTVRQKPEEVVYPVYVIDAVIRSMEQGGADVTLKCRVER